MDVRVVALALCMAGLGSVAMATPVAGSCHAYYPPCAVITNQCNSLESAMRTNARVDRQHPCFLWENGEDVVIGGAQLVTSKARLGEAWFAINATAGGSPTLDLKFKNNIPEYNDLAPMVTGCGQWQQKTLFTCESVDFTPHSRSGHIHVPYQVLDNPGRVVEEGLFTLQLPLVEKLDWPSFGLGGATGVIVGAVAVGAWFYFRRGS